MAEERHSRFDNLKKLHPGSPSQDDPLEQPELPTEAPSGPVGVNPPPADTEPTEPTPAQTEPAQTDREFLLDEDGDGKCDVCGQLVEQEPCDCQPYVGLTIALGILSLLLTGAVVLLAIRARNLKRHRRRRKPVTAEAPAAPAPAAEAPGGIQVGKLHQIGDRESQQDCLAVSPTELYPSKGLLAVVADGMGGLSDGDKMSQTAAAAMMNGFMISRESSPEMILALTVEANQAVNRVLGPANQGRSGTTLVSGIVKDGFFSYVSVGDSRICLYRQGILTQLNREHIYRNELRVQAMNGLGTLWDAGTHPKAAGLTSYLGMGNLKYVDIPAEPLRICGGDKIILMSDGVYNAMTLPELETALALPAQQAADAIGQTIHAKAYRNQDNYTAVILQF